MACASAFVRPSTPITVLEPLFRYQPFVYVQPLGGGGAVYLFVNVTLRDMSWLILTVATWPTSESPRQLSAAGAQLPEAYSPALYIPCASSRIVLIPWNDQSTLGFGALPSVTTTCSAPSTFARVVW